MQQTDYYKNVKFQTQSKAISSFYFRTMDHHQLPQQDSEAYDESNDDESTQDDEEEEHCFFADATLDLEDARCIEETPVILSRKSLSSIKISRSTTTGTVESNGNTSACMNVIDVGRESSCVSNRIIIADDSLTRASLDV